MTETKTHTALEEKNTPSVRFKEFESDWRITTLGSLFTFKNGLNSDKEKYGSGVKFINVLDIIGADVITYDSIIGKVEVTEKELEKNEVVYGDVLFQRSSETREEVGQANVYVDKSRSAVFGGFVIRGRKKENYDPLYMNYLLKTAPARKEITTKSGGSTRYNVGQASLSQVFVNLTSLPEQKKIASFLSAIDQKIQQLTKKKALLEQYKKGVMQQLFSGKLRFKDENGEEYPDWEEKRLGDVGEIVSGLTYSPDDKDDEGVLVLRSSNVHGREITFDDNVYVNVAKDKFNQVELNDILICVRNGSKRLIGKNAMIKENTVGVAFGAFMTVYRSKYNLFLFHYFDTDRYKNEVHKNLGATINSINGSDLKKFNIPFPSKLEQEKIATFLHNIDANIQNTTTQITQTKTFKKGLLQKMFV